MTKVKAAVKKKAAKAVVVQGTEEEYTPFTQLTITPLKVDSNVDEIKALTELYINTRSYNNKLSKLAEDKLVIVLNRIK